MTQRTIVFDFGGVLFETSVTEFYRDRFTTTCRSEDELRYFLDIIFPKKERSASHLGNVSDLIEQKVKQYPEWEDDLRAYGPDRDPVSHIRNVMADMQEVLEELTARGDRIVGLTNWAGDAYDNLPKAFPEILKHFNHVVVSGKIHMVKPNPDIFHYAQEAYGNPDTSEVYFFDDKQANVQSAINTVGWKSFVFKDANTVRQALALPPKHS